MGAPTFVSVPTQQAHLRTQRRPARRHRLSVARCSGKLRVNCCAVHCMARVLLFEGSSFPVEADQNKSNSMSKSAL